MEENDDGIKAYADMYSFQFIEDSIRVTTALKGEVISPPKGLQSGFWLSDYYCMRSVWIKLGKAILNSEGGFPVLFWCGKHQIIMKFLGNSQICPQNGKFPVLYGWDTPWIFGPGYIFHWNNSRNGEISIRTYPEYTNLLHLYQYEGSYDHLKNICNFANFAKFSGEMT